MDRHAIAQQLSDAGVFAIVRTDGPVPLTEMAEALLAGGVRAIEFTMTTPGALTMIRQLRESLGERMLVGVGTVLDAPNVEQAVAAGAQFTVSPILSREVIAASHAADVPVACGAYTPNECQHAHQCGSDFVKLFPADQLGADYVKALRAPLPHLRIIPTGGVTAQTAPALIRAGCVAVAAGSNLLSKEILAAHDWPQLTQRAQALFAAVQEARNAR